MLHLNKTEDLNGSPERKQVSAKEETRWKDPVQMREYIDKLLAQNRDLVNQKSALEAHIQEIITSKSWKLTKPLRAFFEFTRAVRPLWRSRVVRFKTVPAAALRIDLEGGREKVHAQWYQSFARSAP